MSGRLQATARAAEPALRVPTRPALLQRQCACGGTCGEGRQKAPGLQRAALAESSPGVAPPIVHEVLGSPGQPLDAAARAELEPRFGHDFSQVRIHADARAAASARAVDALAYTVGRDVVFGARQYAPASSAGRHLLAHELAHVVQQRGRASPARELRIGQPGDRSERAAMAAAESIHGPGRPELALSPLVPAGGISLQRQQTGKGTPPSGPTSGGSTSSYVFVDAPVPMPPPAGRKRPFVGPLRRWPLPNSTPCAGAGNYFYQFWEPNIQYQKLPSGVLVWWEDYLAADGSSRRRVTLYRPKGKVCAHSDKAAAPPTTAPPVTPAPTTAGTTGGRVALEMRDGIGTYRLLDDGTIIIDFFDGDRWEYVPDGEGTYTWYTKKSQSQYDRTELDEIPVPDEMQSAAVDLQPEME